jgi:putative aldouronate transport system permease protein
MDTPTVYKINSKPNQSPYIKYFKKSILNNYVLYLFSIPALAYIIIFHYLPLYGIQIAFRDFNPGLGIWNSPGVGFMHFEYFFQSSQFWNLLRNTLTISFMQLVFGFPVPIILALTLHYCTSQKYKKLVQTVTYAPHFISMVVMIGMIILFLSPSSGMVNQIIKALGFEPIYFMGRPDLFKPIYVVSGVWQNAGWGSIIYIATLAGVDQEIHEAAIVDGASKLRRIWHIDIPSILPTMIILLILNMGQVMNVGFEKVFLLQNDIVLEQSEVISTYVYKVGLQQANYSYSTAIGLFNNIINFILLFTVNKISKKVSSVGLF